MELTAIDTPTQSTMDIECSNSTIGTMTNASVDSSKVISSSDTELCDDIQNSPYLHDFFVIKSSEFESEDDAMLAYNEFAFKRGFSVRLGPSSRAIKSKELTRKTFYCHKQGFKEEYKGDRLPIYKKRDIRCGCLAKMIISRSALGGKWKVKQLEDVHNHKLTSRDLVSKHFSHGSIHRSNECKAAMDELLKDFRPCVAMRVVNSIFSGSNQPITTQHVCQRARWLRNQISDGECDRVIKSFIDKQARDPDFFYAFLLNDDDSLKHLFWADARSKKAYETFGDVIVFDVTYRTNNFGFPFAPFTGINHHFQSTLFGCAFLSNEREESFVWLFNQFLECMKYKQPKCVLTDQDHAICNAVSKVFDQSRHRLCIWHIERHLDDHMRKELGAGFSEFRKAYDEWKDILDIQSSELRYNTIVYTFNIKEDSWFAMMYKNRHSWIPCYLSDIFWAGMKSSQRSESINAFFDKYVNSTTVLSRFVEQYDAALASRRKAESDEDFKTLNSEHCRNEHVLFRQKPSKLYTLNILGLFDKEWVLSLNLKSRFVGAQGAIKIFLVGDRDDPDESCYKVHVDLRIEECFICSCSLFHTKGIPCSHMLHIMRMEQLDEIPDFFILKRWSITARYQDSKPESSARNGDTSTNLWLLRGRLNRLLDSAQGDAELIQRLESAYSEISQSLNQGADIPSTSVLDSSRPLDSESDKDESDSDDEVVHALDPTKPVKTKGRPKTAKRYISKSDKMKKIKKQRKCSFCRVPGHKKTKCPKFNNS